MDKIKLDLLILQYGKKTEAIYFSNEFTMAQKLMAKTLAERSNADTVVAQSDEITAEEFYKIAENEFSCTHYAQTPANFTRIVRNLNQIHSPEREM